MSPRILKMWVLVTGILLILGIASPAQADGIIIPTPQPPCRLERCPTPGPHPISQLHIRYHLVDVTITDQVAETHVDQVFTNPNAWPVEGIYMFPLPVGAAVSNFTLWVDGKPVEGKVLDAKQARQAYEEIVNQMRDPALLEYADRGAVQASIFPIPPGGERRIELSYSQILTAENGLVRYSYPLNTEKFSTQPLESVVVNVSVSTSPPLRAVYSPSHPLTVNRSDNRNAKISYEANNILPDTDFTLYYSIGEAEAFHLLSYRDPGDQSDPDGFFMLLLAPKSGAEDAIANKDVLLVLDHSGSMKGDKFTQAQAAARYILEHLNPGDRFYLAAFSSDYQNYASQLRPAEEASQGVDWISNLRPAGSTDIHRALLETAAVVDAERPAYLIFLTDGLPTQGVVKSPQILANFAHSAPDSLRVFSFGVGDDVDTYLLDTLSQEHHGQSAYVRPGDSLDEVLSGFYETISTPKLTDLKLDFGDQEVYDIYPNPLPDLFRGSQQVIIGRYRRGGTADVTLTGMLNDRPQKMNFPEQIFTGDSRTSTANLSSLPRLWATRKIGSLLNQIRLHGVEKTLVDQIVRLSIRYGIVTPYTSYLVTENVPLGAEDQQHLVQGLYDQMASAPSPVSGAGAVQKAQEQGALSRADVPPAVVLDVPGQEPIRLVGTHTFIFQDGTWIDTLYQPGKTKPIQVAFLSPQYFKLAQSRPDLAAALALGEYVIVVDDGVAYEVISQGLAPTAVEEPAARGTEFSQDTPLLLPEWATVTPPPARGSTPSAESPHILITPYPNAPQARNPLLPPCSGGLLPIVLLVLFKWLIRPTK